MDKVHINDDSYDRADRGVFEAWQKLDLREVSLPTLRIMNSRLKNTLRNMHEQVRECREELGLPLHNWPEVKYRHPRRTNKRGTRSRRHLIPPYALPNDPLIRKQKTKSAIARYSAFRKKVQRAIRTIEIREQNRTEQSKKVASTPLHLSKLSP